jgi:hypothetical protein
MCMHTKILMTRASRCMNSALLAICQPYGGYFVCHFWLPSSSEGAGRHVFVSFLGLCMVAELLLCPPDFPRYAWELFGERLFHNPPSLLEEAPLRMEHLNRKNGKIGIHACMPHAYTTVSMYYMFCAWLCICACTYACMRVCSTRSRIPQQQCACLCVSVRMSGCMYAFHSEALLMMHVCLYICMYVCMYACMYVCMH